MTELLQDHHFIYLVSFGIFVALAVKFARKPLMGWLDAEILKIRDELEKARQLRAEAEAMLREYKAKQQAAMADAEAIVKHAKEEAARLKDQAEIDLKNSLARHEQQALERIRIAETEAMAEVRAATVDMAMQIAAKTLSDNMDAGTATKLADQAIADMPKLAGAKAKAA